MAVKTSSKAASKASSAVQAVLGSDDAEVKRVARELAGRMTPADGGDFACDVIEGQVSNAAEAALRVHQTMEALQTFPFFGGEKLVWLKNANFLGDTVTSKAADTLEALAGLQQLLEKGLPAGIRFLLSATEFDKRRAFSKALPNLANVQTFDQMDTSRPGWEEKAMVLVREQAELAGLRLDGPALESLAVRTGGERRIIMSELEKIALYLGETDRLVTAADVQLLVPMSGTAAVFELGNALAARDTAGALALLELLERQKDDSPIRSMLVAIIPTFRNLLAVKELMEAHRLSPPREAFFFGKTLEKLPPQATEHLPRKKDGTINAYSLGIAAQHAHRFTLRELRAAQKSVLEANIALVSGEDPHGVLQQLVIRLGRA
jgi:DNA polymerase-3 subunit delta